MNYKTGDYVAYCSGEICVIESITKECFDGVNEAEYFNLCPINSGSSSYYVPCENSGGRIRNLLTRDEILALIKQIPDSTAEWYEDKNVRKKYFHSVLKSNDCRKIMGMIHSLCVQREKQLEKGKKLNSSDEKAMLEAERIIYGEFAFVLEIDVNDVEDFIKAQLDAVSA